MLPPYRLELLLVLYDLDNRELSHRAPLSVSLRYMV